MLDFPSSPTVGQKHPQPPVVGVPVYTWDGEKWTTLGGPTGAGGTAKVWMSETAPAMPSDGDLWWKESTGVLYVYFVDANSSQWVSIGSTIGGEVVRYDVAQTLTPAQIIQAQQNIGLPFGDAYTQTTMTARGNTGVLGAYTCTLRWMLVGKTFTGNITLNITNIGSAVNGITCTGLPYLPAYMAVAGAFGDVTNGMITGTTIVGGNGEVIITPNVVPIPLHTFLANIQFEVA